MLQSPEIQLLILDWYRRIEAGEMVRAAEDIFSGEQGFLAIGTDAEEWMDDRQALIQAYADTSRLGPPEIDVRSIEAYREGSVAWVADRVVMKRPGGVEKLMRHTFVLHEEGGRWKVVHAHYSFGIPEEGAAAAASRR